MEPKKKPNSRRRFIKQSIGGAAMATLPFSTEAFEAKALKPNAQTSSRPRKSVMDLSAQDKKDFTDGILALKATSSPFFKNNMLSYYDSLVRIHQLAVIQSRKQGWGIGHKCPSLLTFHRKLVLLLEDALCTVMGKVVPVPYWDWTNAASVEKVFSADFMGEQIGKKSDNYAVTTGPFKKGEYELNLITVPDGDGDYLNFCPFTFLTRGPNEGNCKLPAMMGGLTLPTADEVNKALACTDYDYTPYDPTVPREKSFRNYLGGWGNPENDGAPTLHNVVHSWTGGAWESSSFRFYPGGGFTLPGGGTDGTCPPAQTIDKPGWHESPRYYVGTMQALQTSANDPVFWIHHSNVDRIWAQWQALKGHAGAAGYVPDGAAGLKAGWGLKDEIPPFAAHAGIKEMEKHGYTNEDMLNIKSLSYHYQPES